MEGEREGLHSWLRARCLTCIPYVGSDTRPHTHCAVWTYNSDRRWTTVALESQLECIDIGQLRSLLRDGRDNAWDGLDICPRTAPSRGAKQCTYGQWFRRPEWSAASPLKLPLTHAAMQRFLRFRTTCHGLPKDIGSQTGVPRRQRLCQLCGADYGDEMHLVFECHGLADLRKQFASIFQERQTMQQFMWQPDMLQVAKFLDAGVKRTQEIDPDAGSNI